VAPLGHFPLDSLEAPAARLRLERAQRERARALWRTGALGQHGGDSLARLGCQSLRERGKELLFQGPLRRMRHPLQPSWGRRLDVPGLVALQRPYGEPRRCGGVDTGVRAQPCGAGVGSSGGPDAHSRPLANWLFVVPRTAALKVLLQVTLARDGKCAGQMVDDSSGNLLHMLWQAAFPLEVLEQDNKP
jgi:hypothetical protein